MHTPERSAASPGSFPDSIACFGHLERRDSRRMLTLASGQAEHLRATAIVRTDVLTPVREAHTGPSWRLLLAAAAGLVLALALLASRSEASASFRPTTIDRRLAVESLQSLSDYVGFEARFALGATDRVLVMSGSDLCGEDFPQLVPPVLWRQVVDAGFESFECSAAGTQARIAVHR
jgi:hypothetical protein